MDVEKLRALDEAATPGPWKFEPGESPWVQSDDGDADICQMPIHFWEPIDFVELCANGALLALLRNSVPAILALAEERDRLREALEKIAGPEIGGPNAEVICQEIATRALGKDQA